MKSKKRGRIVLLLLIIIFSILVLSSFASATKVLHIGASHTIGSYGQTLHTVLSQTYGSSNVQTAAVCGARATHFVNGLGSNCGTSFKTGTSSSSPTSFKIDNLVSSFSPDIVIVSLGTNFLTSSGVTIDKTNIQSLLSSIKGSTCYWVGAPVASKSGIKPDEINTALKSLVGSQCTFIDATAYTDTSKLKSDGIHFTDAKNWAYKVYAKVISGVSSSSGTSNSNSGAASVGGNTIAQKTSSPATSTLSTCNSQTACKEIDSIWNQISSLVSSTWKNMIWNKGSQVSYDSVWGVKTTTSTTPSTTTTSASSTQIDTYIKEAAKVFGIDAALIKAVMAHESGFKQYAVSSTGCKGLMQVCSWSSWYNKIGTKYSLTNDAYDVKSNIYIGTYIYVSKLNEVKGYCKTGDDELKCVIAAYNAGEGTIQGAANAVSKPASWDSIIVKLQDESFVKTWYKDISPWTDIVTCGSQKVTRRKCKFMNLNSYVAKIFNSYQSYKGTI